MACAGYKQRGRDMNEVKIEFEGVQDVKEALRKYGKKAEAEIAKAVNATGLEFVSDVKKRIKKGPKTGVTYWRIPGDDGLMRVYAGNPNAFGPSKLVAVFRADGKANLSPSHQASSPGEAPATDTGGLITSVYFKKDGTAAIAGSRLAYAYYLEFGTQKIAPRPSWTPAAEAVQPKFIKRIEDALRRAAE